MAAAAAFSRPAADRSAPPRGEDTKREALALGLTEANRMSVMAENLGGVGYWRFVPATQTRTWSPSTFAIFGLDPAKGVPPNGGVSMFDPNDQDQLRKSARGEAAAQSSAYEYAITRPDGERRYVRMTGALERDAEGEVSHVYGAIIDVTEAKLREQAVIESETRYRLLADSVRDLIVRYDARGVIEYISPSVREFGYEPSDVIGRPITEFEASGLDQNVLDNMPEYAAGTLRFPDGVRSETLLQRGDGVAIWMESVETGLYSESGEFIGVVAVLRDVTERRKLEEELRRKQIEAEAAVTAKSEFLANMSHELRTPLTAVIGYAGLLAKAPGLSDKAGAYAERIARSGEMLNAIINNVLDFSKVEAGQVILKPEPTAVRTLIDETLAQLENSATQKGLALTVETEGALPDRLVVDPARLNQVLLNLAMNAIKFTQAGGVTLRLRHDPATQMLRVSVVDTGIGIAPEQLGLLFQRFSQIDGANARRFGGAGLGLAISKGLVELMGGEIGAESVEGAGSTFWFTVAAPAIVEASTAHEAGAEDLRIDPNPMQILVVDDVGTNLELISALLDPFQAKITTAADGAQAIEAACGTHFDLVLMDVQMPGMDGLAATRAIRETSDLNRETPIIAVSASVLPSDIEACRAAGMNDHVSKPINPRELLGKIARWAEDGPQEGFAA